MIYPTRIPAEDEIPDGCLLVHNRVRPALRQGTRGFRFWLTPVGDPGVVECRCGRAPKSGVHYRHGEISR